MNTSVLLKWVGQDILGEKKKKKKLGERWGSMQIVKVL